MYSYHSQSNCCGTVVCPSNSTRVLTFCNTRACYRCSGSAVSLPRRTKFSQLAKIINPGESACPVGSRLGFWQASSVSSTASNRSSFIVCHIQFSRYSITSSARANNVSGTARPSALAALRLITTSYFVGACTGRWAAGGTLAARSLETFHFGPEYCGLAPSPEEGGEWGDGNERTGAEA
jgi:hypothetical protein